MDRILTEIPAMIGFGMSAVHIMRLGPLIGSALAPTTRSRPRLESPFKMADMDLESGAVARIMLAPPYFCSSAAGSLAAVSM